jgi:hydrogenase expression/formation protein HypD
MRYIDEYRDPIIAQALVDRIQSKAARAQVTRAQVTQPWVLMEICGGQTHTLMRYGIDVLIAPQVELVHGPGCPVCVTPIEIVDKAVEIASRPDVTFVSYGDMLRVPGATSALWRCTAQ